MHPLILFLLLASFSCVLGKNNVKSLTESLGQEVIEIGNPIKELPADIEEEPSIENEEDEHSTAGVSIVTTRSSSTTKKPSSMAVATIHPKKLPKVLESSDDEDSRIAKELAEIYKDNNVDYKDSAESETKTPKTTTVPPTTNSTDDDLDKAIARANDKDNFKFQPDPMNKAEIERFRTSVDDISCMKKLRQEGKPNTDSGCIKTLNAFIIIGLLMKTLF